MLPGSNVFYPEPLILYFDSSRVVTRVYPKYPFPSPLAV